MLERFDCSKATRLFGFLYGLHKFGGREGLVARGFPDRTYLWYVELLRAGGIIPKYFDPKEGKLLLEKNDEGNYWEKIGEDRKAIHREG